VTKDELKIAIGKRIVELRTEKGWSQSDLARACNKDRQAIEVLENGKVNPTIYTLYEISKGLGVSLRELTRIE
jgi:transcriptional regulator with XRE-family HTH domain